jgi:hypothetical protein
MLINLHVDEGMGNRTIVDFEESLQLTWVRSLYS